MKVKIKAIIICGSMLALSVGTFAEETTFSPDVWELNCGMVGRGGGHYQKFVDLMHRDFDNPSPYRIEWLADEYDRQCKKKKKALAKPTYYTEANPDGLIEFRTTKAAQTVRSYNYKCPQPGKSASLLQALRRNVAEGSAMGGGVRKLYLIADSRGDDVRIYDQVRGSDGYTGNPSLIMSINKWGELRLNGISKDALMSVCY